MTVDRNGLQSRITELAERDWNAPAIEARIGKLSTEGIPRKILDRAGLTADKPSILDRVQRSAEEYNYAIKNCAQGTALALMEEFDLGLVAI